MQDDTRLKESEVPAWMPADSARLHLARCLALAASDPASRRWRRLQQGEVLAAAEAAAVFLAGEPTLVPSELAPGERDPRGLDLGPLVAALAAPPAGHRAEYDRVFGLVSSKECPPYETEYCPLSFSVYRSQQLADVAGFYSAFGLRPSGDVPERPDHVSLEIEFAAWLLAKRQHALRPDSPAPAATAAGQAEVCRDALARFWQAHLAWWLPAFGRALRRRVDQLGAGDGYLGALADVLGPWVALERAALGVAAPRELLAPNPGEPDDPGCDACGGMPEPPAAH